MSFDRHARDYAADSDFGRNGVAPVGRRTLTQRHTVQMSEAERAASHAQLDAVWAGAIQRKEHHGPTAGPSEDDRFGAGPVAADAHGRIIKVDVVGGHTRITIGLGAKQGVKPGMMGYIKSAAGMLCDFQIEEDVQERTAHAIVNTTLDGLHGHDQVVVNPATMPKAEAKHDMHARIIGTSIEGDQVKMLIGFGSNHGARAGMKGFLLNPGGSRHLSFEIAEEHAGHSVAYVHTTIDDVRAHDQVVLNPST